MTTMKRIVGALLAFVLCLTCAPVAVFADVPYATFTKDTYGRYIYMQPAYAPTRIIARDIFVLDKDGKRTYSPLKKPQDVFIDSKDDIYIADTENNRIVQFDADGELVRVITVASKPLKLPQGVFVADNGDIYIADTGNKRIVRLNKDGQFTREYAKPESKFLDSSFVFEPKNMVVDDRGFIYVSSNGSYQGVVLLDPEGQFYGFYGTNISEAKLMDKIRSMFYTKEQLKRQVRVLPANIRNIDIDKEGYIYTVSSSSTEQIKKLNIRGDNLWKKLKFGERGFQNVVASTSITDVTTDSNGNLTAIDKTSSTVMQYDANGKLLFFWAGEGAAGTPQVGLTKSPTAIAANSKNELFILDDALNLIQVFKPTEFGEAIHEAYKLMQDGKYGESESRWNHVVKLNAMYAPAYEGLAQAAYFKGDYAEAMRLYKLAGNGTGYSDSFWQRRLQWFQTYFSWLANGLIILLLSGFVLAKGIKALRSRRRRAKAVTRSMREAPVLIKQLKHAFYILKHPLEGMSDLRYMQMGGWASAGILLVLVTVMLLLKTYYTSFTFDPTPSDSRDSSKILIGFAAVWISWVVCNFLIGNIYKGEARFKDVFVGGSYALFPIVLLYVPLTMLSNAMTLSEASIYGFMNTLIIVWCALLFFWKIQSLQNYGVGGTIVNITLTGFTMVVLWSLIFIITGMITEVLDFVYAIYQEVTM